MNRITFWMARGPQRGLAAFSMLLALVGLLATDPVAVDRGVLQAAIHRDLLRISELAGLRPMPGSDADPPSMPVTIAVLGGPTWLEAEARAALNADPIFTPGQAYRLDVEVVEYARTYGVRSQLWRQGWALRAPDPLWVSPAPWVIWLSALAGAGWFAARRRMAQGIALAGGLAQALLAALPWPSTFARPSWIEMIRQGPMGQATQQLARTLPESSIALGAGVITFGVMVSLFDHRRSSDRGARIIVVGLWGALGLLLWIEACLRAGLLPWMGQWPGWVAAGGLGCGWIWSWMRATTEEVGV